MAWKSVFDNGSPQVQGDAQKHEEFEVSLCKMALRHRRQVGTDRHECSSVPTGRSSSQTSSLQGLFLRAEEEHSEPLFLTRCQVFWPHLSPPDKHSCINFARRSNGSAI